MEENKRQENDFWTEKPGLGFREKNQLRCKNGPQYATKDKARSTCVRNGYRLTSQITQEANNIPALSAFALRHSEYV